MTPVNGASQGNYLMPKRGYVDFFFQLNLLPFYSLCSQGDKYLFLYTPPEIFKKLPFYFCCVGQLKLLILTILISLVKPVYSHLLDGL